MHGQEQPWLPPTELYELFIVRTSRNVNTSCVYVSVKLEPADKEGLRFAVRRMALLARIYRSYLDALLLLERVKLEHVRRG